MLCEGIIEKGVDAETVCYVYKVTMATTVNFI